MCYTLKDELETYPDSICCNVELWILIRTERMTAMRLLHCADLHLDARMTANLDKEKARERKKELLLTFERMVEYAAGHGVDAILIAGDLFDTRNISATARHAVWDAVEGHPEIVFFYLQGNHDTDHFFSDREDLPENLRLFGGEWRTYALGSGRVKISGLELSSENVAGAWHSLVLDPADFNVVMLHGQETGAGAKDKSEVIRLRELKNKGIDYLALGHIHSYKEGRLDARGVWCYPGCLEGRGFDECGEHGFVVLDIDEDGGGWRRTFVPFASRRLYEVEADITGCETASEMMGRIREALSGNGARDEGPDAGMAEDGAEGHAGAVPSRRDLVKVVLTGQVDVETETDTEYIRKRLEPDFYFVKVADETTLEVDADRFMLDESLKGEFVRTVMAAEDLSEDDRAAVIRIGLKAIAGEGVLSCD